MSRRCELFKVAPVFGSILRAGAAKSRLALTGQMGFRDKARVRHFDMWRVDFTCESVEKDGLNNYMENGCPKVIQNRLQSRKMNSRMPYSVSCGGSTTSTRFCRR